MKRSVAVFLTAVYATSLCTSIASARGHGASHSRAAASSSRLGGSGRESRNVDHVSGYTKRDGTHVDPYDRSAKGGAPLDNWSTKGNVNPETGRAGTKDPSADR